MNAELLIPCFNEEANLPRLLGRVPSCVARVVVIDNGSTDKTAAIARSAGALVVHEKRRGMGYAYQRGFEVAQEDFIVCLDGDATYPVDWIPDLLQVMEEKQLDFISCARSSTHDPKAHRLRNRIGNGLLTRLANALLGLQLRDIMSGMWVIRRQSMAQFTPTQGGVPICVEMKLKAFLTPQLRAAEIAVPYFRRHHGVSKLSPWRDGWSCFRLIFCVALRVARKVGYT